MSRARSRFPSHGDVADRALRRRKPARPKFLVPWHAGLGVLAIALGFAGSLRGQSTHEYDLKAVLIFNFTQFVEWPPTAFARDDAPFVIGVLGRDPFGRALDDVVRTETCGNRRIEVVRFTSAEAIRDCHILFISETESANLARILAVLGRRPILTVGDFEGFSLRGGMMRFKKSPEGKIQLRINLDVVKAANLVVSAKLLRIAEIVRTN